MEGLPPLVPEKVRTAAKRVRKYIDEHGKDHEYGECCVKLLRTIENMPIAHRKANPNVILHYEYDSYRSGSFEEEYVCTLASYILIMALYASTGEGGFCYTDRVGKHSQVDVNPNEFTVDWTARGADGTDDDDDEDDWSWLKSERFDMHEETRRALWTACLEWLKNIKPEGFQIDGDQMPDYHDFIETFDAVYEKHNYCTVQLTVAKAYKSHDISCSGRGKWVYTEKDVDYHVDFMDARIAAIFYVQRPTIDINVMVTDSEGTRSKQTLSIDTSKFEVTAKTSNDETSVDSFPWTPPDNIPWATWSRTDHWDDLVVEAKQAVQDTKQGQQA